MSQPFDLAEARAASLNWLTAHRRKQPVAVEGPTEWLHWLGLQPGAGPLQFVPQPVQLDLGLEELRQAGVLGEVLFSALVQSAWPARETPLCGRTRAELLVYFAPEEATANRPIVLDELMAINQLRVQELTPHELLQFSREFWPSQPDNLDEPGLEAWALIHVDRYQTLRDVAAVLACFWRAPGERRLLSLPPDWWQRLQDGQLELTDELQEALGEALAGGPTDLPIAAGLLGERRCRERVAHE